MDKLFEIKENLPVDYEDFRASTQNNAIQRVQFILSNGIDLTKAEGLQEFFANEFANFTLDLDFGRDSVTVQVK